VQTHNYLTFEFSHFINVYATHLFFQPDTIYIHTDAGDEVIETARSNHNSTNRWAQLILQLPKVTIHKVIATNVTINRSKISRIEHKSDFVSMDAIYESGGIYLDWDVYALHDIKMLRETGFTNVVGRQVGSGINNGFWMSRPKTVLVGLFRRDTHVVFDG
jgi:hypothetical protein